MFTILQQQVKSKRVVLVEQQYPYGKPSVYMPTALVVVAAQLMAAGHSVEIVDFNIDNPNDTRIWTLFESAEYIGVSVVGAPYIPQTIELCKRFAQEHPDSKVMLGGQIISRLSASEFVRLFSSTGVIQVASKADLGRLFGVVPSPFEVSLVPAYKSMREGRLLEYLMNEFPLWVSQGCTYNCEEYCSAERNQLEQHHNLDVFREGVEFLMQNAPGSLSCYATSLDFFQNPKTVAEYLKVLGELREKHKVDFRVRALSCLATFLKASKVTPDFGGLLKRAGFWRVGFGVDGSGEAEWKRQGKVQNKTRDVAGCLELCKELGLQSEVIMVTAFTSSTVLQLVRTVYNSFGYLWRWRNVKLRPYHAKPVLPGNAGWERERATVEKLLANPQLFYNLEFNCLGSPITNSNWFMRWLGNLSFLALIAGAALFGRSISYPLLPQGAKGWYGRIAKWWNNKMPIVD